MTESRWSRRRGKRAEEEFSDAAGEEEAAVGGDLGFADRGREDDPREQGRPSAPDLPPAPRAEPPRPIPAHRPGRDQHPPAARNPTDVSSLFANEEAEENQPPPRPSPPPERAPQQRPPEPAGGPRPPSPRLPESADDPIRRALRERERQSDPNRERTPAEAARDELAALLASTEAAAGTGRGPIEPPIGAPSPPSSALEEMTRGPEGETWDAIESMFTRNLDATAQGGDESGLQLDWERPEMFTEPTQEEILRRIGELGHGLDMVQQRLEDLARPLAEVTEPGTRLATAFKRLELIERSFEEMRLQSERNTLKTASALSSLDSSLGELRAAMEEPMWEMSERLTSAEIRLTELQGSERLVEQINLALSKDPFDLVSTRDIDELTENITVKVKRLGGRVERLEAALDRGLSGLEEARRAGLSVAKELNKLVEKANKALNTSAVARVRATAEPKPAPRRAASGRAKATTAKKPAAKKAAAKRTARKPTR